MNLVVVIPAEFLVQDLLGMVDLSDVLSDTGSDQPILEPAIGPFDLAVSLRRERMNDLHIAVLENLFPLRGDFIGQKMVFTPDRVPSLDKSKNRVRIDIIGVREPISKDDGLQGHNMSPAGFFLDQSGIKDETTIIIERGDQIPFLPGYRCPKMIRGVMLNQFSGIIG
jgi:hypothetical protein